MEKPIRKRKSTTMDMLPPNIMEVIFSKLPIANFPACRVVCNNWNELILNYVSSSFSKIIPHTLLCTRRHQMYCIDFNHNYLGGNNFVASLDSDQDYLSRSSSIMCYCNGLLLIYRSVNKLVRLEILNPMTNEYLRLPVDDDNSNELDDITSYRHQRPLRFFGFGLSLKTKQYKVVSVFKPCYYGKCNFKIFTFGGSNNQWRCVALVPNFCIRANGVYFNGALYWIGIKTRRFVIEHVICRFDLENERIESTTSLPVAVHFIWNTLEVFNDSVYAAFLFTNGCSKIEVWRMQNCGRGDSWAREFVIKDVPIYWGIPSIFTYFKFIKCYEDGEILCLIDCKYSILFNPKYGSIKILNQFQLPQPTFDFVCRLDSFNFVSLQKILAGDDG